MMDLPCEGHVLLVGDGDFSFTLSLVKKGSLKESQVTTSNIENLNSIQQHKLAADNMKTLTEMGVQVYLETDARELHTHPIINHILYQRIIFNFPLADRHNIKKNRALLADFFSSCSQILSDDGQVMVTLCKGQGGTPADQPLRSWHDSWQVCSMTANAGFILRDVQPFEASKYPDYHSVGFRFQDKSFNTDGALTHVFEKADVVVIDDDVCARGTVQFGTDSYTCSRYVAEKMKRNLLHETDNPLCLLRERLEASFYLSLGAEATPEKQDWCILPGHKSRISTDSSVCGFEEKRDTKMSSDCEEVNSSGDSIKSAKERKNEANLNMKKSAETSLLVHGVETGAADGTSDMSPGHEFSKIAQFQDKKIQILKLIPENSESVFILIKGGSSSITDSSKDAEIKDHNGGHEDKASESFPDQQKMDCDRRDDCTAKKNVHSLELSAIDFETHCLDSSIHEIKHCPESKLNAQKEQVDEQFQNCVDRVFHCRTSLLENLSDLFVQVYGYDIQQSNFTERHCVSNISTYSKSPQTLSSELTSSHPEVHNTASQNCQEESCLTKICEGALSEVTSKGSHSFVTSGKCFLSGPIVPDTLTVRHEMIFAQKVISNIASDTQKKAPTDLPSHTGNTSRDASLTTMSHLPTDASFFVSDTREPEKLTHELDYVSAFQHIISCLKRSGVFSQISITVEELNCPEEYIHLDGFENVRDVKLICLESKPNTKDSLIQQRQGSKIVAGVVVTVTRPSDQLLVSVLQLDNIACMICNINDPRLLWSQSKKLTDQFQASSFPRLFKPFSLYPMMFVHDLSFWLTDSASEFDVSEMYNIILYIAGDLVCKVSLIDRYTDPSTGQKSRCYRLHFTSHDMALPYLVSWKLQSLIRMEIAQKLGVTLR